jgi:calcineurin-like phosphoesterase family protein
MSIYFTSDTHYGHANIIKYSKRPFNDAAEMNKILVKNWNKKVTPNDEVYHLGDVGMGREDFISGILGRLNGRKYLIKGNHDKKTWKAASFQKHWIWIKDYFELTVNGQFIVLHHYPELTWNKGHHGSWMLHGHCHHSIDHLNVDTTRLDVGVDGPGFDYSPLSFDEVKEIMDKKNYKAVDHHGDNISERVGKIQ